MQWKEIADHRTLTLASTRFSLHRFYPIDYRPLPLDLNQLFFRSSRWSERVCQGKSLQLIVKTLVLMNIFQIRLDNLQLKRDPLSLFFPMIFLECLSKSELFPSFSFRTSRKFSTSRTAKWWKFSGVFPLHRKIFFAYFHFSPLRFLLAGRWSTIVQGWSANDFLRRSEDFPPVFFSKEKERMGQRSNGIFFSNSFIVSTSISFGHVNRSEGFCKYFCQSTRRRLPTTSLMSERRFGSQSMLR